MKEEKIYINDIINIEKLLNNSMPAKEEIKINDWIIRDNKGYTYRACCICPGEDMAELEKCEDYCIKKDIPIIVKNTEVLNIKLSDILKDRGYEKVKTVNAMILDNIKGVDNDIEVHCKEKLEEEWIKDSILFSSIPDKYKEIHKKNMQDIKLCHAYFSILIDDEIAAIAYATVENEYVGIYDLHVSDKFRRQGLATAICKEVINYGLRNGANKAYLIVNSRNENAIKLYKKMGYVNLYSYDFYKKGAGKIID